MASVENEKELKDLLKVEAKLLGILKKINQELSRNEVEFLHLKSLIETSDNQNQSGKADGEVTAHKVVENATPSNTNIEVNNSFQSSLTEDLDLRPIIKLLDDDVEFDTDHEEL